jgi:hypothetical protein
MSPYIAMGNNPITSFDPDGGQCYDANGNQIACPDDDIYDEYRDNPNNRIDIMPEVVVVAPSGEDEVDPNLMNGDKGKEYLRNREINEAVFKENMNGVMLTAGVIVTSGRGNPISRGAAISYGVLGTLVSGAILEVSNFANDMNVITSPTFLEATDSSKNERHGDGQGLTESEEKLIEQLEGQMQGAAKKVKEKIKKKIRNIRENAQRRSKGEEHSRTKKGN